MMIVLAPKGVKMTVEKFLPLPKFAIRQQIHYLYIKIAFSDLLHKICFFRHCWCIGQVEKSIPSATFIIGKYHMHSLSCAIYFPLLGYVKYGKRHK